MRAGMVWWWVVLMGSFAPSVQASEAAVLVQDPTGDTALRGVAMPAGAEAYDLLKIGLEAETLESIVLRFDVARMGAQAPPGEVGAHFRVGASWWIAGWTTVPFPSPPFVYRGGFYCPTDKDRHVDPARCDAFTASVQGNAYVVTMRRATLHALNQSVSLEELRGYADLVNDQDAPVRLDETARGVPYVFATGRSTPTSDAPPNVAEPSAASDMPPTATPLSRGGDADGPSLALLLFTLAVCGLVCARRARGRIS